MTTNHPNPAMDELLHTGETITCDECGSEVTEHYVMEYTIVTDDVRSRGPRSKDYQEPKCACVDCAYELFETGEWEAM